MLRLDEMEGREHEEWHLSVMYNVNKGICHCKKSFMFYMKYSGPVVIVRVYHFIMRTKHFDRSAIVPFHILANRGLKRYNILENIETK